MLFLLPVYKVRLTSITEENVFIKYTATLLDIYKAGEHSFIHSFTQQIFSTYYVPLMRRYIDRLGIVLDTEDTTRITQPEFLPY